MAATSFVFAASDTPVTAVQCIGSAVAVRENILGLALTSYTTALSNAYKTRAADLRNAYSQTGDKNIKASVKLSWDNYTIFMKGAKNIWSMAKSDAWAKFRASVKACKTPSAMTDASKSGSEL
jgi:hypothetical protein